MATTRRTELAERMRALLAERPRSVYEVLQEFPGDDYRTLLQAWGDVRAGATLVPDAHGRYAAPGQGG